jgi:hypothetical protein
MQTFALLNNARHTEMKKKRIFNNEKKSVSPLCIFSMLSVSYFTLFIAPLRIVEMTFAAGIKMSLIS